MSLYLIDVIKATPNSEGRGGKGGNNWAAADCNIDHGRNDSLETRWGGEGKGGGGKKKIELPPFFFFSTVLV